MPHPIPEDPGMRAFMALNDRYFPPDVTDLSMADQRARYDDYCVALLAPLPQGVAFEDIHFAAQNPARKIPARQYRPIQTQNPGVTILYMHGGGFIVGGLESHHDICAELCAATGTGLISLDYRLAPEHVHPAQIDDTISAYMQLAVQGRRIVVGGDSAGGNLAAALCLHCKAAGLPMPLGQFLIYPGLGGDATRGSYVEMADAPLLTTQDVLYYARTRSGGTERGDIQDASLSPLQAQDFSGLPPAVIVSADIDPLRDDCRAYRDALHRAGVPALWRNEPHLLHGYLRARNLSPRAGASFAWICRMVGQLVQGKPLYAAGRAPTGPDPFGSFSAMP